MNKTQSASWELTAPTVQILSRWQADSLVYPVARFLGLALGAMALMSCLVALGADPAEDKTKAETNSVTEPHRDSSATKEKAKSEAGIETQAQEPSILSKALTRGAITGGMDPHGDSLLSIQNSLTQFAHPEFMLRLFLSLSLAVACAWLVAWHPRRTTRVDPLSDFEERKTLIILGVVGAVVAELSGTSPTLAFVIFGIGALMRFRTVLDNPKVTGKAILVVVIGLACGMGSWTMAVFVTAFSWVLIFWLDSRVTCEIRVRLDEGADPNPVYGKVQPVLVAHGCRIVSYALSRGKKRMVFFVHMPARVRLQELEADVKAKFPRNEDSCVCIQME
jgi:hypothetical protein